MKLTYTSSTVPFLLITGGAIVHTFIISFFTTVSPAVGGISIVSAFLVRIPKYNHANTYKRNGRSFLWRNLFGTTLEQNKNLNREQFLKVLPISSECKPSTAPLSGELSSSSGTSRSDMSFTSHEDIHIDRKIGDDIRNLRLWKNQFNKLQLFYNQFNHTMVARNYSDSLLSEPMDLSTVSRSISSGSRPNDCGGPSLFNYVTHQRTKYKQGLLSQYQIDKLDTLNFCWDQHEIKWQTNFEKLRSIVLAETNSTTLPISPLCVKERREIVSKTDKSLDIWLQNQHINHQHGKLLSHRYELLNSVVLLNSTIKKRRVKASTAWKQNFRYLKKIYQNHNNAPAPAPAAIPPMSPPAIVPQDTKLGRWVSKQRNIYRKYNLQEENEHQQQRHQQPNINEAITTTSTVSTALTQDQIEQLNSIGFIWDVRQHNWNHKLIALKQLLLPLSTINKNSATNSQSDNSIITTTATNIKTNTTTISRVSSLPPKWRLWIKQKQRLYDCGMLVQDEADDLLCMGLLFPSLSLAGAEHIIIDNHSTNNERSIQGHRWNNNYQQLVTYFEATNSSTIPAHAATQINHGIQNPRLGVWFAEQRVFYKRWYRQQKENYNYTLEEEICSDDDYYLEEEEKEEAQQRQLQQEDKKQSQKSQPSLMVNRNNITLIASTSTTATKYTPMTIQRIRKLESLPNYVWNITLDTWDDYYEMLQDHVENNGHANVPEYYPPYPRLGAWVRCQRMNYKQYQSKEQQTARAKGTSVFRQHQPNAMTPQRIALLNKIGFVWDCHDYIYTKWLAELKLYAKEHHTSTHPPYKDPKYRKLSLWCRHQRLFYRQQQLNLNDEDKYNAIKNNYSRCLTPERIRMLNETGFEWLSARYCKTGFALEWDVLVAQINKELPKMKSFQDTIDEIDMSTAEDDVFSLWDEEED